MQDFKSVRWFRFFVIIAISFLTSMTFNLHDDHLSLMEFFRTVLQAAIAGFAYLQCPEASLKRRPDEARR